MLVVSIILIALTLALAVTSSVSLRGRSGVGLRSGAALSQLLVAMSVVLVIMQMAEASIIYDNDKLYDKYVNQGIDLYFLSKSTAVILAVALALAVTSFALIKLEKRIKPVISFIIVTAVTVVGAVATVIALPRVGLYDQYVDMLIPVIPVTAWCLLGVHVNTLLDGQKKWQRILLTVINGINLIAVIGVAVVVIVLTKSAIEGMDINNAGYVLLTMILLALASPSIITAVSTVLNCIINRRK